MPAMSSTTPRFHKIALSPTSVQSGDVRDGSYWKEYVEAQKEKSRSKLAVHESAQKMDAAIRAAPEVKLSQLLAREIRALSPRSSRLPTCDVMIKPATGLTVQLSEEDIDDPRVPSKMKANTLMVLYEVCCSSQIVTLSALLHCVVLLLMKLKVPS